jgi:hypothetical protein
MTYESIRCFGCRSRGDENEELRAELAAALERATVAERERDRWRLIADERLADGIRETTAVEAERDEARAKLAEAEAVAAAMWEAHGKLVARLGGCSDECASWHEDDCDCGYVVDEDAGRELLAEVERLREENAALIATLDRDSTGLGHALVEVVGRVRSGWWITEGRGSYEWNDDRYRYETARVLDDVKAIAETALRDSGNIADEALKGKPRGSMDRARDLLRRASEVERLIRDLAEARAKLVESERLYDMAYVAMQEQIDDGDRRAARWKALARRLRGDVLRAVRASQLALERWQFWMKAADTESEVADKAHKGWAQCREQLAAAECNLLEATEEWDSHCNSIARSRFADAWVGIGWAAFSANRRDAAESRTRVLTEALRIAIADMEANLPPAPDHSCGGPNAACDFSCSDFAHAAERIRIARAALGSAGGEGDE